VTTASTILEVFEPPDGLVAHSAVLVAMTGAQDFLEDALVRFTGLKARQRAELGVTNAYLLLDPHSGPSRTTVFGPHVLPGLYELQPRPVDPSSLLHAKLALLAFARRGTGAPASLRLAVLTANFTYTCAKHQLELAWVLDVPLDGTASARERADIAAAGRFVRDLIERRYYTCERDLPAKQRRLTGRLDTLLKSCTELAPDRTLPRFIHSLDEPLYPQIRSQMKRSVNGPRNLLVCGSGFYEEPTRGGCKPMVLGQLEDLGVLTSGARLVAIAEPKMAGALAPWARSERDDPWELVEPHDPVGGRSLHAKFIYVGYVRDNVASNGCLYLGSGNLSRRGLFTAGAQAGERRRPASGHDGVNIECGVVLSVDKRMNENDFAKDLFWKDTGEPVKFADWEPGTDPDEEVQVPIPASPVLLARLEGHELRLQWRDDHDAGDIAVHTGASDWMEIAVRQPAVPLPEGARPGVLHVRDGAAHEWTVPIIDAIGRTCWTPPQFKTYGEALAALLDFPIRPAEASDDDDEDADDADERLGGPGENVDPEDDSKTYALHAAAELLEQTSALQRSLKPDLLEDWLDHIERLFEAAFPESLVATWQAHRIDVFSHLAEPELRPPGMTGKQRERYDSILERVARQWRLR
jgi:hypothetical protein